MKVTLADYSGFCFGVTKAINTAFDEINRNRNKANYSLGPLIHNPQVVKSLEDEGVRIIEDLNDIKEGNVIIRSHGVPEEIYRIAEEKQLNVIDTTCPFVRRIQKIVKEYCDKDFQIAIIGNPHHPEVIGINGWCYNRAVIIQEPGDIERINKDQKLCVVVQTTMSLTKYRELIELLKDKVKEIEIFDTICHATKQRQDAAKKLAGEVDAMIVIGGSNSSNTQKLVAICKEVKPESTFHVEGVEELDIEALRSYERVGVTAGASTPIWVINEIIEALKNIN